MLDGQLEPRALHLVVEVGEREVGQIAPEAAGRGELGAQHDAARGVVLVDQPREAAELEHVAAQLGAIDVGRAALDQLVQVDERLQDAALARAVRAEEQRQRSEVDALPGRDALEILDLEGGQHEASGGSAIKCPANTQHAGFACEYRREAGSGPSPIKCPSMTSSGASALCGEARLACLGEPIPLEAAARLVWDRHLDEPLSERWFEVVLLERRSVLQSEHRLEPRRGERATIERLEEAVDWVADWVGH